MLIVLRPIYYYLYFYIILLLFRSSPSSTAPFGVACACAFTCIPHTVQQRKKEGEYTHKCSISAVTAVKQCANILDINFYVVSHPPRAGESILFIDTHTCILCVGQCKCKPNTFRTSAYSDAHYYRMRLHWARYTKMFSKLKVFYIRESHTQRHFTRRHCTFVPKAVSLFHGFMMIENVWRIENRKKGMKREHNNGYWNHLKRQFNNAKQVIARIRSYFQIAVNIRVYRHSDV